MSNRSRLGSREEYNHYKAFKHLQRAASLLDQQLEFGESSQEHAFGKWFWKRGKKQQTQPETSVAVQVHEDQSELNSDIEEYKSERARIERYIAFYSRNNFPNITDPVEIIRLMFKHKFANKEQAKLYFMLCIDPEEVERHMGVNDTHTKEEAAKIVTTELNTPEKYSDMWTQDELKAKFKNRDVVREGNTLTFPVKKKYGYLAEYQAQ